jgi:hypothetical protein
MRPMSCGSSMLAMIFTAPPQCWQDSPRKLDVVAAWSIDRLGRSLHHVAAFMSELGEQRVALYLHQQNVDGTTSAGKAMLGMAAEFAEFEHAVTIERINSGLARARAQGKQLGRPKVSDKVEREIRKMLAKGTGKLKIARTLGVGVSTVQQSPPRSALLPKSGAQAAAKTSRSTSGRFAAIASNERAAPVGLRRPCSQSCNVRTDTPSTFANFGCESPERMRASRASGTSIWCTRAARPLRPVSALGGSPPRCHGSLPILPILWDST